MRLYLPQPGSANFEERGSRLEAKSFRTPKTHPGNRPQSLGGVAIRSGFCPIHDAGTRTEVPAAKAWKTFGTIDTFVYTPAEHE